MIYRDTLDWQTGPGCILQRLVGLPGEQHTVYRMAIFMWTTSSGWRRERSQANFTLSDTGRGPHITRGSMMKLELLTLAKGRVLPHRQTASSVNELDRILGPGSVRRLSAMVDLILLAAEEG